MRLNNIIGSLTSTYDEWSEILVNNLYIRKDQVISWANYEPWMLPSVIHRSDVENLEVKRQYSFQIVEDGSIVQLYYRFSSDGNTLVCANLAYYGASPIYDSPEEPFLPGIEGGSVSANDLPASCKGISYDSHDSIPDDPIVPWLRIDYEPEAQRGPLHHACHMHIGLFKDARLPLSRVPSPQQFIEFIIALCYPQYYKKQRLDATWERNPLDSFPRERQ